MRWSTLELVVFPLGRGAGLGFRSVGGLVISQFCVRDTEARGGRVVRPGGEFPVKPKRADIRRILIAHVMRHESVVRDSHKVFKGCAAASVAHHVRYQDAPDI